MSLRLLTLVWERAPYKDGSLLLMLALADFSDDSGFCWPSVIRLAHKARMVERHARRILRKFEEDGFLETVQRGAQHKPNNYRINVDKLSSIPARTYCPEVTLGFGGGTSESAKEDAGVPPTVMNRQEPPGEEKTNELTMEAVKFVDWFLDLLQKTGAKVPHMTPGIRVAWADTYEKLVRIDGRKKEEIVQICRWARRDSFWSSNFLSPAKLRQKNNDQVFYYDVFLNKLSSSPRNAGSRSFELTGSHETITDK